MLAAAKSGLTKYQPGLGQGRGDRSAARTATRAARPRDRDPRPVALRERLEKDVRLAELRAEAAERAQRELIITAEDKLQGACRALEQAQSCIEAQKDKLTATELRAQMAEAEARKAKEALALVEEAIRKRLLRANPDADSRLTAMAG